MKKVTKKEAYNAYKILNSSKIGCLKSTEKSSVLNLLRQLRKISVEYEQDWRYIEQKLKPEGFDEKFMQAVQYEQAVRNKTSLSEQMAPEAYTEFKEQYKQYQSEFTNAMSEEDLQEVELNTANVTLDILSQLMTSNDWTVDEYFQIENLVEL